MKPFFSIVMAVYNREDFVVRAIESVLCQTFIKWELIIIDDGSTDNSCDAIKPFLNDKRITYYKLISNSGVAKARNKGINLTKGNFITFLDSDDEYQKDHLQSRYGILKNSNIDLLHGGVQVIGNNYVPDKDNISKMILIEECVVGGTFFLNNELPFELKKFDESITYSEDSELFERISGRNRVIRTTDSKTYIYHRENEDSICNRINK